MAEGSKIYELPAATTLNNSDVLPMSNADGTQPTKKVTVQQLADKVAETLGTGGGNAPVFIPTPRVEVVGIGEREERTYYLLFSWEDCQDKRFLDYQPKFVLFRYKQQMNSSKRDTLTDELKKKKIGAGWKPPLDGANDTHNPERATQWTVGALPFPAKTTAPFNHLHWFRIHEAKEFTVETFYGEVRKGRKTFVPKGSKLSYQRSEIDTDIFFLNEQLRRNMFAKFAIQITIDGKQHYGGFSSILQIGYTRIKKSLPDIAYNETLDIYSNNYMPMIQVL